MVKLGLLVRAGTALANAFAAWMAWRNRPVEANHEPRELTEPDDPPRRELPPDPPLAAHAACEEADEIDTDVELADDEDCGPPNTTQLSGGDV